MMAKETISERDAAFGIDLQPDHAMAYAALASMADAVYGVDTAGRFSFANAAFEAMTGCALADLRGTPTARLYVPEAEALFTERRRQVYSGITVSPVVVRVHAIQCEVQDLGGAVVAWYREFQEVVAAHGVTLQADGIERLGPVAFHASTLRRALLNLVQNAAEAMPQGGTIILAGQSTADHVQLQVRDTGSGIASERLAQIFEPLHTTKPGGTGLGLYIVQEVATAHGGQVTVQSVEGQGTTFTLILQRASVEGSLA